jgi:hypothetical protein
MKRSVQTDPQPGDVLSYRGGWRIRVTAREGGVVVYISSRNGSVRPEDRQTLQDWQSWTTEAKVVERAGDPTQCVVTPLASGPCSGCHQTIAGPAHVFAEGLYCEGCCGAAKHARKAKA